MSNWESSYSREESTFQSKDGSKIYYQVFRPKTGTKKVLIMHHGIGEHGGRYMNLVDAMAGKGYAIYLIDARGHGRSDGRRGVVNDMSEFYADIKQLIGIAKQKENVQKVTLMGHSMGAIITYLYVASDNNQDDIEAFICSALPIKVQTDIIMDIKKGFGGLLSAILPTLTIPTGLDATKLSHDKSVIDAYNNDPLVHGNVCSYLGNFLLNCYDTALNAAGRIKIPVYMFHGKDDEITLLTGTIDAFERLASPDKTLKLFDGLYHETMNEIPKERAIVFKELLTWIDKH